MRNEIKSHFESVFQILKANNKIVLPDKQIILEWDKVLEEWIEDDNMKLFARKGGETRGSSIINQFGRVIITTDNTPAHWVFKNLILDNSRFNKSHINQLIMSNEFPISFIRKKSEYDTLVGKMVADKSTRLNEQGWKLAHINRIALKRGKKVKLQDFKNHHFNFLSLSNMYLIDKSLSGLAEVELFNEIVKVQSI
ncbi:MAG: hypothetical protein ACOYLG_01160 [Chitinophagaceae bacterium]